MTTRCMLQRLDPVAGGGSWIHTDLPVVGAQVTVTLSGPGRLTGRIPVAALPPTVDGLPALEPWATALWVDMGPVVRGGIVSVVDLDRSAGAWVVDCVGISGYLAGQTYPLEREWVGADPAAMYAQAWVDVQAQPGGQLGVTVDAISTPVRVGMPPPAEGVTDPEEGPVLWSPGRTPDIGRALDDLAAATPFDYRETTTWRPGRSGLRHRIELGYPRLGDRRQDLRLAVGENVIAFPSRASTEWASIVYLAGAGDGQAQISGLAQGDRGLRLRRAVTVSDRSIDSTDAANARAVEEQRARSGRSLLQQLQVMDSPSAPVAQLRVGDEVPVIVADGSLVWVRIVSAVFSPDQLGEAVLTVQESS